MDEDQRFLLKCNMKQISQDLDVDDVFSHLQSTFVLDIDDVEVIKHEITSRQKAEKLISILLLKDRNYFDHFYNALKYAEYDYLSELLIAGIKGTAGDGDVSDKEKDSLPDIKTMLRDGGVPQQPNVFVNRPVCSREVKNALEKLKSKDGFVIIHGMPGCGKTVLTSYVLDDEQLIHSCFPGGIFWVSVGNVDDTKLLIKMQNLCSWLDPDNEHNPKNLEIARNRLRKLFAHDHPRCLLVLDDVWSETVIKYFNVRVRTIVTTRNSSIVDRTNTHKIKVLVSDSFTTMQSKQILAQWVNCDISDLPPEANLIINECKSYPLAISMIGALLKSHKSRWGYYLKQIQEKKTSKFKNKLSYQYQTLYEAFSVSLDDMENYLKEKYAMLCIFEESVSIPLDVLAMFWELDSVETEDALDELIERSLVHFNDLTASYSIHNIQLSFLKEFAERDNKTITYHNNFVEKYIELNDGKLWNAQNDHYIYTYLISHILKAEKLSLAINLLTNFFWLHNSALYSSSPCIIDSYNQVIKKVSESSMSEKYLVLLKDMRRFISVYSHLVSEDSVDLIQLALSQPFSDEVYTLAKNEVANYKNNNIEKKLYFDWQNRPNSLYDDLQLTSQIHNGGVNCCNYSHSISNQLVVSCGEDKTIRVWNSVSGIEILKLEGHTDSVNYCEFSPDDQHIVSCSSDKTIRVWNATNGKVIHTLESHTSEITCCKFSPVGDFLVSGSMDGNVKIWKFQTGQLVCTLRKHSDVVNWCCFSPDSRLVVSCSNDLTMIIWDVERKEIMKTIEFEDFISFCLFTKDGNSVLATSLNSISMYSVNDGSLLLYVEAPSDVLSLDISPDQNYIVCAHNDMIARLYDLKTKTFVKTYMAHASWLNSVNFSPDGKKFITSSHDGFCKVWNVVDTSKNSDLLTNNFDAAFTGKDDYVLIAVSKTNQIQLTSGASKTCSDTFDVSITSCVLSSNGTRFFVGFEDGTIKEFDVQGINVRCTLKKHSGEVIIMKYDNQRLLSCSVDNLCIVWCLDQQSILCSFNGHNDLITDCKFVTNGKRILSSSYDGKLVLWDSQSGESINTYLHDDNAVLSCQESNNGKCFLSCTADSKSYIWNSSDETLRLMVDDHEDAVRSIVFSSDDTYFATGSDDGTVKVWKTENGDLVCECEGHNGWVTDLKFSNSNDFILTLSDHIRWFSLNGDLLQTFHTSGDSLRFICCSKDLDKYITVDNYGFAYMLYALL